MKSDGAVQVPLVLRHDDGTVNVTGDLSTEKVWSLTQFYSVDFSQSRIGDQQTHNQCLRQLFVDGVLGFPEAMHKVSRGPFAMSAQKALQGSETETRELQGGTTENCVSLKKGSLICPPGKSMILFTKNEIEKN